MTAMRPTAMARRLPCTFKLPAPLPESGAVVLSVGAADEVDEVGCCELVLLPEVALLLLPELVAELKVEVTVKPDVVLVVNVTPDVLPVANDVADPVDATEPVNTPVAVPVAP